MKYGESIFTSSEIFTLPKECGMVQIFLVGGGGFGYTTDDYVCGGGGGGYTHTANILDPDFTIEVSVASWAGQSKAGDFVARAGYRTISFNGVITRGGHGGSGGGGASACIYREEFAGGFNGGSDGADGEGCPLSYASLNEKTAGGTGQGTTTRAFGESNGTLYAGGGGGGGFDYVSKSSYKTFGAGKGGAGGGGNGACYENSLAPTPGGTNTGGGGGGGAFNKVINDCHGGSGICIIRWGFDNSSNWLGYSNS